MSADSVIQAGPCAHCGATDYQLSMGGPSLCPACDCGYTGSRAHIEEMRATTTALRRKVWDAYRALKRIADRDVHGMDIVAIRQEAQEALSKILPSVPAPPPATAPSSTSSTPPAIEDSAEPRPTSQEEA